MTSPHMQTVVREYVSKRLAGVRVCMPATIRSYDPATQLAACVPVFAEGDTQLPIIHNVPVQWPGGGGYALTFPLLPGDPVLIVFADRSLETWLSVGSVTDPGTARAHSLSDAICLPGVRHRLQALPDAAVDSPELRLNGTTTGVKVSPLGAHLGDVTASLPVALASLVDAELTKIGLTLASIAPSTFSVPYAQLPTAASKVFGV